MRNLFLNEIKKMWVMQKNNSSLLGRKNKFKLQL